VTEVILNTNVPRRIMFDGHNYYMEILGKRVGPKRSKAFITNVSEWLNAGGMQDIMDVMSDVIDKAFKESEHGK
jgi:hypothetical protein